jgi:hypothetical protein
LENIERQGTREQENEGRRKRGNKTSGKSLGASAPGLFQSLEAVS